MADEVDYLAGEVKILAINMAITLAKMRCREKQLGKLEPQFTELIKKANDTSQQVTEMLKVFKNKKRMVSGLPASSEIIEKRGAYDSMEAKLNHVYQLSQEMMIMLSKLKQQEVG